MMENTNNQVTVIGKAAGPFTFSHSLYGEGFYNLFLNIPRLSNTIDTVPVTVSDRLFDVRADLTGKTVVVHGQFRSYSRPGEGHSKLVLSVFATDFLVPDDENGDVVTQSNNSIEITGFICKPVLYRTTVGGREICDAILAVNRSYGRSDYIPCVFWGRNARFAGSFRIGDEVHICGRIQSRDYVKKNQ